MDSWRVKWGNRGRGNLEGRHGARRKLVDMERPLKRMKKQRAVILGGEKRRGTTRV